MFCPNCGTQNADDVVFCAGCGTKLAAEQAPAQPVYQQPVYQQPTYQQPVYQQPVQPASVPGKGLGIASMVLGIVSLVFYCIPYLAIICAIIGVALGGVGLKKSKDAGAKNGMAVAGLVCSIIALGLAVWALAAVYSAVSEAVDMFNALEDLM